ncbi:MAG TPA: sulfotransferase, partial [Candidatus Obscuribacterales bacterium]
MKKTSGFASQRENERQRLLQRLRDEPRQADLCLQLARLSQEQGQLDEAVRYGRAAALLQPDLRTLAGLAELLAGCDQLAEAREICQQALGFDPHRPELLLLMGRLELMAGAFLAAGEWFRHAQQRGVDDPQIWLSLGRVAQGLEDWSEAASLFARAQAAAPEDAEALLAQAALLEARGQTLEAYTLLAPRIAQGQAPIRLLTVYITLCRRLNRQGEALQLLSERLGRAVPDPAEVPLYFQLGWLYDQQKNHAAAFHWFQLANALQPAAYDPAGVEARFSLLQTGFSRSWLARMPRAQAQEPRLIFIVGMSRSGTTLAEQILASHPQVMGGGERLLLDELFREFIDPEVPLQKPEAFPRQLLDRLAGRYLDAIRPLMPPDKSCFTDKMPDNFRYLFLIELLFPTARIVHCRRDPL